MSALKVLSALSAAAVLGVGLTACGDDSSSSTTNGSTDASGEEVKVGFSNKAADQFVLRMQDLAIEQIEAQGMSALQPVSAGSDPGKQVSDVQSLVSAGAQALVVVPQDSKAIKPALDFLESKDIPSVALDTAPIGAKTAMVVTADNVKMGEDACKQMGDWLKGEGTVLSMQGDYNTSTGRERGEGFKDCMDESFPNIEVIEKPTYWDSNKAAEAANTQLKANKDIDGIYMASDTVMLSPVLSALKAAGRDAKVGEPGHVYLITIDGSPYGLEQIRAGTLDALLSQPLDQYAEQGVSYLKQAYDGATFKVGPTDHDSRVVERDGNLTDLLPAPLVTAENASDTSLWGNAE